MLKLAKIWNYIKTNPWTRTGFCILLILLFVWNLMNQRNKSAILEKKLEVAEQNYKASQDTIRIVKDRAGRVEYNKLAFLTDKVDNLAKLNTDLADEVKKIKGSVSTIVKGEVKIVEKPVPFLVNGQLLDSTVIANFKYDTTYSEGNFRKLAGYTKYDIRSGVSTGEKTVDEIGVKFVTGIKNLDKGKPEIFLKSDYPGFQVTAIDGAILDPKLFQPKKKTPLITPSITVGWTPLMWDNKAQVVRANPANFGVTVGIGFNILKLTGIRK